MKKCPVCGKEVSFMMYTNACSNECFTKAFWNETLDGNEVIIDGKCYHIGREDDISSFRGYDGAKYHIIFNDGREVYTTNLWHNGTIPAEYNKQDNARFDWEFLK